MNLIMDIAKQHFKDITMTRLKIHVKPLFMVVVEEMTIDIQLKKIVLKHVLLKVNYNDKKSNRFFHQKRNSLTFTPFLEARTSADMEGPLISVEEDSINSEEEFDEEYYSAESKWNSSFFVYFFTINLS